MLDMVLGSKGVFQHLLGMLKRLDDVGKQGMGGSNRSQEHISHVP